MIPVDSIWIYYGPGTGRGERHKVVFSELDSITSVSMGHAWHGPRGLFLQHFKNG